ncbi:MAG: FG-GAP-like repeat-containing protein [Bacteroidia bacterium]|nr:FG-GAP-like repeat-containing protein [Bacteroidia bacterium]MDW8158938.1 FG-GAP-like repeat-containing protein [Bacteroidia bacterium]
MKCYICFWGVVGAVLSILPLQILGVRDTLRYYNPNIISAGFGYRGVNNATLQVARFEPKAPGVITKVILALAGEAGTATLRIYGHEGGVAFPQLKKNIITPLIIQKTQPGIQRLVVELPTPIRIDNNQFFIGVSNLSNGVILITDTASKAPTCQSGSGGNYYFQYLNFTNNWPDNEWRLGRSAYCIDVIMELDKIQSPRYFGTTNPTGIPNNISNHSIAWGDYDKDNHLDLLLQGRLFRNKGNGDFEEVTTRFNFSGAPLASLFIDMDNDNDLDILFLRTAKSTLYINQGNTFDEKIVTGIDSLKGISSFSVADINLDGYPDLFIGQLWSYYGPNGPDALPNYLLINNRANDFVEESSLRFRNRPPNRRSRGSSFVDFDNDGDLDLFVANYFLEPDELWQNDGRGYFTNIATQKQIDWYRFGGRTGSSHGTGCDWSDYDNDGDMDLLLPGLAHPAFMLQFGHQGTTIYQNTGAPSFNFTNLLDQNGIEYEETHAGGAFGDVNNDGLQDIFITTFYGCRYVDLYEQQPNHQFLLKTFDYGIDKIVTGEDAVWVDANNDGKLDLAAGEEGLFRLWMNIRDDIGNFIQLDLEAQKGNRMAIGAKVKVYAGGKSYTQEVNSGRGVRSQKPTRLHFGLGSAQKVDSVVVNWPDSNRTKETFYNLQVGSINKIIQGRGNVTSIHTSQFFSAANDILTVYPNPTSNYVHFVSSEPIQKVSLWDITGKLIFDSGLLVVPQREITLFKQEVGISREGWYFYQVQTTRGQHYGKVFWLE